MNTDDPLASPEEYKAPSGEMGLPTLTPKVTIWKNLKYLDLGHFFVKQIVIINYHTHTIGAKVFIGFMQRLELYWHQNCTVCKKESSNNLI